MLTKTCLTCTNVKPLSDFVKHSGRSDGYTSRCKACAATKERLRVVDKPPRKLSNERTWEQELVYSAMKRGREQGVPCHISPRDIAVPLVCPVLGIPIQRGVGHGCDNSPSIDKIVPALGYVKGNIVVVSMRANRIKNDATLAELQLLAKFYSQYG